MRQRIDDIHGLWDDLKELALARQEVILLFDDLIPIFGYKFEAS